MSPKRVALAVGPNPLHVSITLVGRYTNHSAHTWSSADRIEYVRRTDHIRCEGFQGICIGLPHQWLGGQVENKLR